MEGGTKCHDLKLQCFLYIVRKVYLDDLPLSKTGKTIQWNKCIGKIVSFEYDDVVGNIKILEYNSGKLHVLYNGSKDWIKTGQLIRAQIGKLIGAKMNCTKNRLTWKYHVGDKIVNDVNDLTITKIKKGKGYQFLCNKCGYDCTGYYKNDTYYEEYWLRLSKRYNYNICPCCAKSIVVPGINDLATLTPNSVIYFPGNTYEEKKLNASKYTPYSNKKIDAICPNCNRVHHKMAIWYVQKHFSCNCKDGYSYPEKFMVNMLDQIGIEYDFHRSFIWCKFYYPFEDRSRYGVYDFYIPSKNIIIEMDGGFGHGNKKDTINEDLYVDNMKDKLALDHEIKVIRIDSKISSKDYISSSILNSELSKILNLESINFDICNEYAKSNIRATVINDYKTNKIYAAELARKYKINKTTVLDWIKQEGIDYTSSYESKGGYNEKNSKPVIVNGLRYQSARVCQENSMNDFGIYIRAEGLRRAIRDGRRYKGLICSYE